MSSRCCLRERRRLRVVKVPYAVLQCVGHHLDLKREREKLPFVKWRNRTK